MNSSDLIELLRRRYDRPAYAFFDEVRNKTGFSIGGPERFADGLAVSLYPSRGIELLGFEVKVSRSDWKRELEDPTKAAAFARYCSRWFLVAPEGLVSREELPEGWGLLEARTTKRSPSPTLREVVKAPKRTPEPITLGLFASLVRALDKERERAKERVEWARSGRVEHPLEVAEKHHGLEALDDLGEWEP